jgi:hypothetical protein
VAFGAETSGTILEFDADLDLTTPVDEYAVDSDVASLRIDSTTLVIESRSGRTVRRKFFDDINQLMDYSLSKLPFDGDGTHRVTLDNRVLCTLFHPSGICDAGTLAIFD